MQIGRFLKVVALLIVITTQLCAKDIYVSPSGNNSNDGLSIDKPKKTIEAGIALAVAGDYIYLRGGSFTVNSTITIAKSGTNNNKYYLFAYADEKPILDCSGMSLNSSNRGVRLTGDYWSFKGLQIKGAGDNGMNVSGSYNRFENCAFYDNRDTGLQFSGGASYNQIINCDSYWNADPPDYGDADGFAIKMDVGSNNYFYGCRAWLNCDDGWDGYLRNTDNVTNELENCWVFKNGWLKNGTDPGSAANGNGFKMGGSDGKNLKHNVTLTNCLAFDNKSKGFDQNNNKGNMTIYNGTAYNNKKNNFSIPSSLPIGSVATVKNSVDLGDKISFSDGVVESHNSWLSMDVTSSDFISINSAEASAERKPDGSLPDISYMHLAQGSQLIDAGIDIGLPYKGSAPDMGAFESNYTSGLFEVSKNSSGLSASPNPAQSDARFSYNLQHAANVHIELFNVAGSQLLKTASQNQSIGDNSIFITINHLPNGIYICQLISDNKMIGITKLVKQ